MMPLLGPEARHVGAEDLSVCFDSSLTDAKTRFRDEGLPFPPVPDKTDGTWRRSGNNAFATCNLTRPLYDLQAYLTEAQNGLSKNFVALGFDGHGLDSWAMHFYLVQGPVAIFLQLKWGGALDDVASARDRIEGAFTMTEHLFKSASHAYAQGGIQHGQRMVLSFSDFSEPGWGWAGQPDSWRAKGNITFLDAISAVPKLHVQSATSQD